MPRTHPISKLDREIAARLKEFRRGCKCTRSYLASQIGVTPAAITRIELGRVPLKYDLARKIFLCLNINSHWVAKNVGSPRGYVYLPDSAELKVPSNAVFSDVFEAHILPLFNNTNPDPESEIVLRFQRGKVSAKLVEMWFVDVPDGCVGEFEKHLDKAKQDFFSQCPIENPGRLLRRRIIYKKFFDELESRRIVARENSNKSNLTEAESYGSINDVKALLPKLLERLNKASAAPGKKSELAKFLGVPLASVSRWLSGDREPGGEITLKLFSWVEQQERQK